MSIITFSEDAKQKSGLICMNGVGKQEISRVISNIHIEGRTEIIEGLDLSFQVISKRLQPNQMTSVILLSDGVDNNGETALNSLTQYSKNIRIRSAQVL